MAMVLTQREIELLAKCVGKLEWSLGSSESPFEETGKSDSEIEAVEIEFQELLNKIKAAHEMPCT